MRAMRSRYTAVSTSGSAHERQSASRRAIHVAPRMLCGHGRHGRLVGANAAYSAGNRSRGADRWREHDRPDRAHRHRPARIDLYWRPGCGFCAGLQRGLDTLGVERVEHNIWDDPADAAVVRRTPTATRRSPPWSSTASGSSTRRRRELLDLLAERAPHLLPVGGDRTDGTGQRHAGGRGAVPSIA